MKITSRVVLPIAVCIGAALGALLLSRRSGPPTPTARTNRYDSDDQSGAVPVALMMAATLL